MMSRKNDNHQSSQRENHNNNMTRLKQSHSHQQYLPKPANHEQFTTPPRYKRYLNRCRSSNDNNLGDDYRIHRPDEDTKATPTPKSKRSSSMEANGNKDENESEDKTNEDPTNESETKWDDDDQENKNRNSNSGANNNNNNNNRADQHDRDIFNANYDELETWGHEYNVSQNRYNHHNHNGYNQSRSRSYGHYQKRDMRYDRNNRNDRDRNRMNRNNYNNGSKIVCKFFNPYFNANCKRAHCEYSHLSHDEFMIYCRFIRKEKEIDAYSQRQYEDALSFIKSGRVNQAFSIFSRLARKYELDAHCNFWLGRCYAIFENATPDDLEHAKFYYQKAICLKPNNASFHSYYSDFMIEMGRRNSRPLECYEYRQARIHILKALELNPCARYTLSYAKLLDEIEGEFFEAKKHYKIALKTYGSDTRIRLNYARLLHKMGNFRASKQEFGIIFDKLNNGEQQYHGINARWIWPHFHYAKLLVDMRYFKTAKQEFELCVNIMDTHNNKYFGDIYYEFSKLLFNYLNDNDHAYYYINKAVSLSPRKLYYKKLLYSIQDAYYKRNVQSSSKDEEEDTEQQEQEQEAKCDDVDNEDDYGLPEDEDIAESMGQLSLSSCSRSGFHAMTTKPKLKITPNKFVDDVKKENNNPNNIQQKNYEMNQASLDIPKNPEMHEMETRFCETEFDRFVSSDNLFQNESLQELFIDKFEDEGINDIRWLLNDNALNDELLETKIKMNKESIVLWKKKVNIFRKQYNYFIEWLKRNNFYNKYFKKFQIYGILSLDAFFYYIKGTDDILYMIGSGNEMDAEIIWQSAQNQYSKIKNQ